MSATSQTLPSYLTEKEVSVLLRCSPKHISNLRTRGLIDFTRLGSKRVVYSRRAIDRFIAKNSVRATAVRDDD
jgi:hypothetical protein